MVLELLHQSSKRRNTNRSQLVEESLGCQYLEMHTPSVLDLTQEEDYASQAALWGIEVRFVLLVLKLSKVVVYGFWIISCCTY
jgi:hypothetical protein